MSKLLKILIKNIENEIHDRRLTKTEFAKQIGMTKQSLHQLLSGDHSPKLSTIEDIATALNMSPQALLGGVVDKQQQPSIKDEIKNLIDSIDDDLKLSYLRSSAKRISTLDMAELELTTPKKLKKSS